MDGSNPDGPASACGPLLPHYVKLYRLDHLAKPLDLISTYIPAVNRTKEILKLGLGDDVCAALAEAMALDNVIGPGNE